MMEAQMEEERAAVSLIYEPDNEEEQNLDHYEEDRLQVRDGAMDRSGLKSVNPIQTSKANRETFTFPKELYVSRGSNTEESTSSQKQEDVSRYYVEQPTLRQYGQELPELRQNTAFTEICRPPLKVLAEEVWSQEAQAAIETDIGPLQTLRDLEGNPEVSIKPIGQQGISQFNKQCQPRTTSWPQSSQLPQRTTTTSWPQSSQPPQRTTTTSCPPIISTTAANDNDLLAPIISTTAANDNDLLPPNHLNHRSERQRPLGPNHLNRRSDIFIVMWSPCQGWWTQEKK